MAERLRFFDVRMLTASWRWRTRPPRCRRRRRVAGAARPVALPPGRAGPCRPGRPQLAHRPLAETPITFLHGIGRWAPRRHPSGRTILLDWAYPGSGHGLLGPVLVPSAQPGPPPESKRGQHGQNSEDRTRRSRCGDGSLVSNANSTCGLAAIMVTFGWEKALGDEDELRWWETRVRKALERQDLDLAQPAT